MDRILLIDGHNQMWRACVKFGATKPEPGKVAQPDEVIFAFNFFRNLRPLIEDFEPDKCFFVLEGHPQFRYDLFADYKANRIIKQAAKKETTEIFFKMKDIVVPILQHFPVTTCRAANYEADDVVGTLCENMKDEDLTILSNDSDYIQLLQRGYPNIRIYNPIKKTDMEAPTYPYIAWKSLAGDNSDNIPALLKPKTKAGEKAAEMLNTPELFQKFMEVEENRANFQVNRQLIEFRPVPVEEIELKEGIRNFDLVKQEFAKMQFESIINDKSWEKYTKTFNCLKY
jgi:5'-3' exonuclease